MTLKQFMYGAYVLPARTLSGISNILFGSYQRDDEGKIGSAKPGLLGLVLDSIKFIGRNFSNLLSNHQQAIASAFWISLILAGAAALTFSLWPAALTFITTLEIAGYSIAAVVGADVLAQVIAIAALTALASSVAVYATAAFVNTINFLRGMATAHKSSQPINAPEFTADDLHGDSHKSMSDSLGNSQGLQPEPKKVNDEEPVHAANPLTNNNKVEPILEIPDDEENLPHLFNS